ncbi:FAD/NAD(P)-binding protein [Bacillus anthracis]|uniref:FAD/NAD(P)-binding protein n=1 Tax=Bacillus anthracis TaxID=1392 RepID=UPI00099C088B|nr:FAD/NAD(P)-binding protein [Bacillus anthracis]OPD54072.1 hypothetical protein BVG01_29430 [Bacillus anthracis]
MYHMAIIGCGAMSVAFIYNFVQHFLQLKHKKLSITIFEKAQDIGIGLPYSQDLLSLRLNQTMDYMSISSVNRMHFQNWIEDQKTYSHLLGEKYIPRIIYGEYLQWCLQETIHQAADHVEFDILNKEVIDITDQSQPVVHTFDHSYKFDMVLLCTGHIFNKDPYQLLQYPCYIDQPYPLIKKLSNITKKQNVAILGSGLTAIDIAISLRMLKHEGSVHMISRQGQLPFVQTENKNYSPMIINTDIFKSDKNISIKTLLYVLKQEFKLNNLEWDKVTSCNTNVENYHSFKYKLQESRKETNKYHVASQAIYYFLCSIWNKLSDRDKEKFNKEILPFLSLQSIRMPYINAKIIMDMMQENLKIKKGLKSLAYHSEQFIASFKNNVTNRYDWVINATGLSRDINHSDSILHHNLLEKGLFISNPLGGIKVDFDTSSIIDKNQNIHSNIKVIGHLASGTYFITNGIDYMRPTINNVIKDVLKRL